MKEIEKNNEAYKALSLVSRRISELEADLRSEVERLCDENEQLKNENATLRTQLVYISGVRIDELQAENARLRELVRRYVEYTSQDRCEGCVLKSRCNEGDIEECWQLTEIRGLARELGVEL